MTKTLSVLLSLFIATATLSAAEAPATATGTSPADQAWAALENTLHAGPGEKRYATPADQFVGIFTNITNYLREADSFIKTYPADPRRWDAVLNMKDFYVASLDMLERQDAATKAKIDAVLPPAQRAEWTRRVESLKQQLLAANDVKPATRYRLEVEPWFNLLFELMKKELPEDSAEWKELRAGLDGLTAKFPELTETRDLVKHYTNVRFAAGKDTPVRRAELASLAESANRFVQDAAQEQLKFLDLAREPLEIAFTAADGRKVDLKDLRGKVVLIDFWATWCMPCIEEIPSIKQAYATYHDRGFEVIGITLEDPRFSPKDTDAQKQEKLEAARKRMLAFVEKNGMPWPQYFDGKWWKNDLARRFAINSIPAMFLLDQDGKLVSTNARGPKLEQEIKRLLKL